MHRRWRLTGSPLSSMLAGWTNPNYLISVQRGSIILNAVTSNTATITAVSLPDAVLIYEGSVSTSGAATADVSAMRIALTNATTVTATVNTGEATNHTAFFAVYHYMRGFLKSVQRGTGSATLGTAVGPNAQIFWLGFTTASVGGTSAEMTAHATLSPPTTVTATGPGASTVGWQVVDF